MKEYFFLKLLPFKKYFKAILKSLIKQVSITALLFVLILNFKINQI